MSLVARRVDHDDVRAVASDAWIARLQHSVAQRVQSGLLFPRLPPSPSGLEQAAELYRFAHESMDEKGRDGRDWRECQGRGYLDFGCGWGEVGRFFLRDFRADDMVGMDLDPERVAFCRNGDLPGRFEVAAIGKPLPFEAAAFRLITAPSALADACPDILGLWMAELLRVLAPGGLIVLMTDPALGAKAVARAAAPHSGEVIRYVGPGRFAQAAVVVRKRVARPVGFWMRVLRGRR
jgi:SAM-dependent methyltransferase